MFNKRVIRNAFITTKSKHQLVINISMRLLHHMLNELLIFQARFVFFSSIANSCLHLSVLKSNFSADMHHLI